MSVRIVALSELRSAKCKSAHGHISRVTLDVSCPWLCVDLWDRALEPLQLLGGEVL